MYCTPKPNKIVKGNQKETGLSLLVTQNEC